MWAFLNHGTFQNPRNPNQKWELVKGVMGRADSYTPVTDAQLARGYKGGQGLAGPGAKGRYQATGNGAYRFVTDAESSTNNWRSSVKEMHRLGLNKNFRLTQAGFNQLSHYGHLWGNKFGGKTWGQALKESQDAGRLTPDALGMIQGGEAGKRTSSGLLGKLGKFGLSAAIGAIAGPVVGKALNLAAGSIGSKIAGGVIGSAATSGMGSGNANVIASGDANAIASGPGAASGLITGAQGGGAAFDLIASGNKLVTPTLTTLKRSDDSNVFSATGDLTPYWKHS